MCFKHLPIEVDSDGKARLKEGLDDPWGVSRNAERRRREVDFPRVAAEGRRAVMRAAGSHAFGFVVDHRRGS